MLCYVMLCMYVVLPGDVRSSTTTVCIYVRDMSVYVCSVGWNRLKVRVTGHDGTQ